MMKAGIPKIQYFTSTLSRIIGTMDLFSESFSRCVLEMLPGQDPVVVDAFIHRCNLNPETLITVMSFFFATAEHEKGRLQYFSSTERRDDLYRYNQKERRTVFEVPDDFPSVQIPFEWLVQLVPPLKPKS
ncbi:hypothetical protein C5167_049436 [Papaver somniferum]|uniref:Sulfite reductase [NADPH] flavoprotein alpha-component-like FAD-binding domain-containing protein n=1 Tax=Papaver somniferum TaxID=3469 RepID=A0A4Y7KPC5_PAPSO|nr:hypothetical protein C5167_049436 [Papaver somniferum]